MDHINRGRRVWSNVLGLLVATSACWSLRDARADDAVPVSLREAIAQALTVDPNVARAESFEVSQGVALRREHWRRLELSGGARVQEVHVVTDVADATLGLSNFSVGVAVPIFAGFRIRESVQQVRHLATAAEHATRDEKRRRALQIALLYTRGQRAARVVDMHDRSLDRLGDFEMRIGSRVTSGLSPDIDLARARSRRLALQSGRARAQSDLDQAVAELRTRMQVTHEIVLSDEIDPTVRDLTALSLLNERIGRDRPDVLRARSETEASARLANVRRAPLYPVLDAFSLAQYGNNPVLAGVGANAVGDTANPFAGLSPTVQVGARLRWEIPDVVQIWADINEADLVQSRAALAAVSIEREAEAELAALYARAQQIQQEAETLNELVGLAAQSLAVVQARYDRGQSILLEVLEAEIALFEAERRVEENNAERQDVYFQLTAATGVVLGEES